MIKDIQLKLLAWVALTIVIATISAIGNSKDTERERVERIAWYDYMRDEQVEFYNGEIRKLLTCISKVKSEMGTDVGIKECGSRDIMNATGSIVPVPSKTVGDTNAPKTEKPISKVPESDKILMDKVCEYGKLPDKGVSPLCGNWKLFYELKKITEDRLGSGWQWFNIMVGMSYAESHIGINYARDGVGGTCVGRNNWGGAKYKINDDNTRIYRSITNSYWQSTVNGKVLFMDKFWCNLFPFHSIQDYWISKSNGLRYGFAHCKNSGKPVTCISYKYVGNPDVSEKAWVWRVGIFLK